MPRSLRMFFERSLDALAVEAPAFHESLCRTLNNRQVCIRATGERFTLTVTGRRIDLVAPSGAEHIRLDVTAGVILALVDGELLLEEALRTGRLSVYGGVAHVPDLFDALVIYVRGAIRCPSFPVILSDFRRSSTELLHEVQR